MTKDEAIANVKAAFSVWEGEFGTGDDWSEEHEARDMAIEALKTEAIPIEWLKEWAKKEDNFFGGTLYASLISTILTDWQLRKEE